MARRSYDEHTETRRRSPAKTPEERESALVSMAYELAEKQIAEGSASAQIITHFVKAGSTRDQIEKDKLRNEVEVLKKKVETMEAAVDVKNLMEEALNSFKGYSGQSVEASDSDYYE